jgi:hypothetical protein
MSSRERQLFSCGELNIDILGRNAYPVPTGALGLIERLICRPKQRAYARCVARCHSNPNTRRERQFLALDNWCGFADFMTQSFSERPGGFLGGFREHNREFFPADSSGDVCGPFD